MTLDNCELMIYNNKCSLFRLRFKHILKMAEDAPMYSPFFGVMGATAAVVFGGECF